MAILESWIDYGDIRNLDLGRNVWTNDRHIFPVITRHARIIQETGWQLLLEDGGAFLVEG